MIKKINLILLSTVSAFAMHNAEININDKDLEIGGKFDLGQVNTTVEPNTTFIGVKYLGANNDHANVDINGYIETNFLLENEIDNTGVIFGIGVKANYTKINSDKFISIPLGFELGYTFPVQIPVSVSTQFYYAPESLAFAKAKNFLEYRFFTTVEVIEKGALVLGYRTIDTNMDNRSGTQTYNESVYFGFNFQF